VVGFSRYSSIPCPAHPNLVQKTGDGPGKPEETRWAGAAQTRPTTDPPEFERPNKLGTSLFKLEGFSNALVSGKQGKSAGRSTPSADRSVGNSASMSGHRLPEHRLRPMTDRIPEFTGFSSTDFGRLLTERKGRNRNGTEGWASARRERVIASHAGGKSPQFGAKVP
jgi:hypothetical protein